MHTEAEMEKNIFLTKFIKSLFFAVFAFLLVFSTVYFDKSPSDSNFLSVFNLDFRTKNNEKVIDNAILRMDGETFPDENLKETYAKDKKYVLELSDSHYWGDFSLTNADFNLKYSNIVLIPKNAQFDLTLDNGVLDLKVFNGDVYLGILGSEIEYLECRNEFSDVFLNTLIVPKNTNLKFTVSRITPKYATLLPDKLQKQMDFYTAISAGTRDDQWIVSNLSEDIKLREEFTQVLKRDFLNNHGSYNSSILVDSKKFFQERLTLISNKKTDRILDSLFSDLDAALYLYANSKKSEGEIYLNDFIDSVVSNEFNNNDNFKLRFEDYLYKLSFFIFNEDLNDAYLILLNSKLSSVSYYKILDSYWFDVYNSIDFAPSLARNSLNFYYNEFKSFYAFYYDEDQFKSYILNLNFLFDNLFLKYSDFYTDSFFILKGDLEDKVIRIYADDSLKQEVLQSMVSNKIEILRRTFSHFKNGKISLEQAQKIYDLLLSEVKTIMDLSFENDTAVISVFKTQLKTIEDFWGYLNATEYNSSAFYGQSHDERYKVYLSDRKIIPNIDNYFNMNEFTGVSLDEAKAEVKKILEDSSVTSVGLFTFNDASQRFVEFDGVLNGYAFKAEYDRYNNTVKNVFAFDKEIASTPTSLKNLAALLESKLADLADTKISDDEINTYLMSNAERVARNFVMEKLLGLNFVLDVDQIKQLKDEVNVYRITETYLADYKNVILTFDYHLTGENVTNLYMIIDGKPLFLQDTYTLVELVDLIYAEKDFSLLESRLVDEGLNTNDVIIDTEFTPIKR